MLIEEKLNFTEEQRSYVESVVKSRPMSRGGMYTISDEACKVI